MSGRAREPGGGSGSIPFPRAGPPWSRAVAVVLLLAAAPAAAVEADTLGRTFYLRYCSSCHGQSARGDGPVAPLLDPRPDDLTRLAERNHGRFPFLRVARVIDGRETLRAHGDPDMPVWGEVLDAEEDAGLEPSARAAGKLRSIVEYLESVQVR